MKAKVFKMSNHNESDIKQLKQDVKSLQIQTALLTEYLRAKIKYESNPIIEEVILNSDFEYQINQTETKVFIK